MNNSATIVNENNLRENQARIDSLIKDRQKTLEQYNENLDSDQKVNFMI